MVEPILSLAMSMYSIPGVYALLLGSGVSRGAQIPTGWEVVQDLCQAPATMKGEDCVDVATADVGPRRTSCGHRCSFCLCGRWFCRTSYGVVYVFAPQNGNWTE
jgi:hypothetical protein